ncbi:hypothetical protein EV360DRAFT_85897 [Lentinula raphanica]|nr:hypothetical protein EV360DRAFT_85897 [Lentinula raphanica]
MYLNVTLISLAFALVSCAIPLTSVSSDIISKAPNGSPSSPSRNDPHPPTYEALFRRGGQCCALTRHPDPETSPILSPPETHRNRNSPAARNVKYMFCSPSESRSKRCKSSKKPDKRQVNHVMNLLVQELMTAIWSKHSLIPSDYRGIPVNAEPQDFCPYTLLELFTEGITIHLDDAPYPFSGDGVVTLVPDKKPKTFKVEVVVAMMTQQNRKVSTLEFELSQSVIAEIEQINRLQVSYGFCSPSETRAKKCDKGKKPETAEEADEAERLAEVDKTMRDLSQGLIYEMYAHNPESPSHQAWMQVLPQPKDRFPSPITAADLYKDGTKIYLHDAPFIGNALVQLEPVPFTRKFSVSVYKAKGKKEGAFSKEPSFTFSFEPSHAVVDWDPSTVLVADSD